ncbi:HDOD domain-containing protein [Deferribacter autotrophicus]|nr:HDOD domain-containing protein [Deferribacter autotrophicus]
MINYNNNLSEVYIEIGKCEVVKSIPCRVKIVLGSCVGVLLIDRNRNVVGGIHILLPNSKKYKFENENVTAYADKGIKYLINLMKKYGCVESNLEAIMAGGASIGGADYFDIGMQNYIAVKKILNEFDIKIIHEDCLGEKPRVLVFDTTDYKFNVFTLGDNEYYDKSNLSDVNFSEFLKEIDNVKIEVHPRVDKLIKLIKLRNKNIDFDYLEQLVKSDDLLTLSLLKHVNSAYYSPRVKITNVRYALSYLGMKNFYKFVSSELLKSLSSDELKFYSTDLKAYRIHVFTVALFSDYIAEYTDLNSEDVFIAGLFHDIGKIILDKYTSLKYDTSHRIKILRFVENSFKTTLHAKVGGDFLKRLGFPKIICEAVYTHHTPHYASDEYKKFVSIIAFSNAIVSNYILGSSIHISKLPFKNSSEIVDNLGIDFSSLEVIINQVGYFFSIAEEIVND